VRYCIGELPTRFWKRSASTDLDVSGDACQLFERPRVRRTRMQRVERRADDAIAETREPSGAPGALLVHVEARAPR
jgi:hypothetical protein